MPVKNQGIFDTPRHHYDRSITAITRIKELSIKYRDAALAGPIGLADIFTGLRNEIKRTALAPLKDAVLIKGIDEYARGQVDDRTYNFTTEVPILIVALEDCLIWMENDWPMDANGALYVWKWAGDKRTTVAPVIQNDQVWLDAFVIKLNAIINSIE